MEENKYYKKIINVILANKERGVTEIHNLSSIKIIPFDKIQYVNIIELIKSCNWQQLDSLIEVPFKEFREYLDVVKFNDQNKRNVVACVYDSDELWQDPQIIDIFFLDC